MYTFAYTHKHTHTKPALSIHGSIPGCALATTFCTKGVKSLGRSWSGAACPVWEEAPGSSLAQQLPQAGASSFCAQERSCARQEGAPRAAALARHCSHPGNWGCASTAASGTHLWPWGHTCGLRDLRATWLPAMCSDCSSSLVINSLGSSYVATNTAKDFIPGFPSTSYWNKDALTQKSSVKAEKTCLWSHQPSHVLQPLCKGNIFNFLQHDFDGAGGIGLMLPEPLTECVKPLSNSIFGRSKDKQAQKLIKSGQAVLLCLSLRWLVLWHFVLHCQQVFVALNAHR